MLYPGRESGDCRQRPEVRVIARESTGTPRWARKRFSLDDAARIVRSLGGANEKLVCPGCGGALDALCGEHRTEGVFLVSCGSCGRSLVVRREAAAPDG
jgi:hypothetical protein